MRENNEKLLQKAEYLTQVGRWREAISLLLQTLAQDPQNFRANCLLSLSYYQVADYEKALQFAEKTITFAPDQEWGYRLRSVILVEKGEKKEALKSAEEAVRLAPYEPFALQILVNAYLALNKLRKAEETALRLREIAPNYENSFFVLGNVYLQLRRYYEAEESFRKALQINPDFADARNNLGVALLRQKQDSENSSFDSSNLSLFQKEESDKIHTHFSEAMKLEPNNQIAAQNLHGQFNYLYVFYGFLAFVPFTFAAFFVAPAGTIMMIIIGIISFFKGMSAIRRNRQSLTPEIKTFLKSSNKGVFNRFYEFVHFAINFFKKTWKPHTLAVFAVFVRHVVGTAKLYTTGWTDTLAYVLLLASIFWLVYELRKS